MLIQNSVSLQRVQVAHTPKILKKGGVNKENTQNQSTTNKSSKKMKQKNVKRRLVVGADVEKYLAELFKCSYRMVKKAMYVNENSALARRIQMAAREKGAYVELIAPECETFHLSDGQMVQAFDNGAVLKVTMNTGYCLVTLRNKIVKEAEITTLEQLEKLQLETAALK